MRNRYPGTCYRCGERVGVGEGHFERAPGGWRVQHAICAIEHRGTDLGKPGATEAREARQIDFLKHHALGTGKKAQRARVRLRQMNVRGIEI